jgi:hypothetical protein
MLLLAWATVCQGGTDPISNWETTSNSDGWSVCAWGTQGDTTLAFGAPGGVTRGVGCAETRKSMNHLDTGGKTWGWNILYASWAPGASLTSAEFWDAVHTPGMWLQFDVTYDPSGLLDNGGAKWFDSHILLLISTTGGQVQRQWESLAPWNALSKQQFHVAVDVTAIRPALDAAISSASGINSIQIALGWQAGPGWDGTAVVYYDDLKLTTTLPPPGINCSPNKNVECGTAWSFDAPGDTCATNVIQIVSTTTNAGCGNTLTATRTWTVTDACGQSNTCTQTVTVQDTSPPVITCAADKTVTWGAAWSFDVPSASDACGAAVIEIVSTTTNVTGSNAFTATRTWSATDACGHSNICTQVVAVVPAGQAVALFDSPLYVDTTSGGTGAESDNLQASLTNRGFVVVTFTNIVATTAANIVLLFPEQEVAPLAPALTAAERSALSNFVAGGGLMIVHGSHTTTRSAGLLNLVFGFGVVEAEVSGGVVFSRTVQAAGTAFTNAPASIASQNGSDVLLTASLPAGARSLYETNGQSLVAEMYVGVGKVIFLGWDWYNAYPIGTVDGGWLTVLASAVNDRGPVSPTPPMIWQQPASQTVVAGVTATFSVVAAGSIPLAYQWSSSCGALSGATNAVLTLPEVSTNQSGCTYWAVVTNAYGVTTSAVATLTVVELGPFADDFEPNIDLLQWSAFGGTVGSTVLATTYGGSHSSPNSLWFGDAGSRYAASRSLNTVQGGVLDFWLRIANGSSTLWEQADLPDEGIVLEYSVNGGSSWVEMGRYNTSAYTVWTHIVVDIPVAAQTANTQFRWRQLSNSGTDCDHWALDDVGAWLGPRPPTITTQPASQTVVAGVTATFSVAAGGSIPLAYQWSSSCGALPGATNALLSLPDVSTNQSGCTYWVVVTNAYGVTTSAVATLTVSEPPPSPDFQIIALRTNNSRVVDHDTLTSDDRGGIAVSTSQAFVTGDGATARFSAADLSGGTSLGIIIRDSLCADLRTETVYLLGNGSTPLTSAGGTVTTLIELNSATGQPSGTLVPLSAAFTLPSSGNGIFSGYGRVVAHNGTRVYDVFVPSGLVVDRGPMTRPAWYASESWSVWGVAEYFGETLYLTYRESGTQRIVRSRVGDGAVSVAATFTGLSDMASFTVSPSRSRWYFHYEGSGQFGGTSETLGYADAQLNYVSTNPPVILSQPASQTNAADGTATFSVSAWGSSPLAYEWRSSCGALPGATNALLSLPGVSTNQSGCTYWVVVTNAYGVTTSAVATLTVVELGPFADDFEPNIDLLQWSAFGGTVGSTVLATTYGGSHSSPNSLWFGDAGSRYAASRSLNTVQGGVLDFWLRIANGGSTPWEQADLPDEGIVLEYSVNGGSSWVEMGRYNTSAYTVWTHIVVDIPAAARTGNTQFRWWQLSHSGTGYDHWALDDVSLEAPRPPAIVRQPLTQTAETGSAACLRVVLNNPGPGTVCRWYFNGTTPLAGATNAWLNFAHLLSAQAGSYTLVVTNVCGAVTSAPAMLNVIPAAPRRALVALSVTGEVGSLLHVDYADTLGPGSAWQALESITLTNPLQVCVDASARLPSSRFYRAWQANTPSVRTTLGLGLATELILTGLPGSTVRVDWITQFGPTDAWVPLATVTLTGASQTYVDLTMIRQPPRLYRFVLVAAPPPAIVRQPLTQTAEVGSVAGFRVFLTNAAPGTVCQWYFNGTPLAGATNTSLKLADAQAAQIGTYTVVVSNAYGAVTSAPALLNVIPAVPRRTVAAVYLTGDLGSLLNLDYTSALLPTPTWQTLASLTLTNPPQLCLDLTDPMPAARFYRVWQADTPSVPPAADLELATELTLTGTPGTNLRVDYINRYGPIDAWVTLATVPLTSASQTYVDLTMIRQPPRLYRLVPVP